LSSLGAIVATLLAPVIAWVFLQDLTITSAVTIMALVLLIRHKDNFRRLYRGQEHKV